MTEGLKVDDSEAKKEAADWERRRARVTAALVPGLKKQLGPRKKQLGQILGKNSQKFLKEAAGANVSYESLI